MLRYQLFFVSVVSVSGIGFLKDQCQLSLIRRNARWKPFSNSTLLQKLRNCKINRLIVKRRATSIPLTLDLMHQGKAKVQKLLLVKHIASRLLIKVLFSSLFFFYATNQGFVYQHFPSCCCFSGVAFCSSHCEQKPSASSGNLPTSLSMCAHV